MSRFALMLCAILALGGCQTTKSPNEMSYVELKQYAATLVERCRQEGAKEGPEMQACINQEARADETKRARSEQQRRAFGMALANASKSYGDSLQRNAYTNRPVNCTSTAHSTWVGGTPSRVNTTCW